ncbi:putative tRNA modification GTPase mnmE [Platanthera guangdongensis]|uniref:GTPase Der n=1 Tax=Platanthera guangdongensis TaxID=2320717 RepID=A0ABR2M1C5_9ASPA
MLLQKQLLLKIAMQKDNLHKGMRPPGFDLPDFFAREVSPSLRLQSSSFCTAAECDINKGASSSIRLTHYKGSASKSKSKKSPMKSRVNFTKMDPSLLPTVILVGRPNVGKSALFNRLIRRREALVYNTPDSHVTRDIREGVGKLGDLRFKVLDSAGLETEATSGTILSRTTEMTGNVLARTQLAIFLIDVREGLQPLDKDVGKWMRKHAPKVHTIVAMNKSESLDEEGLVAAAAGEAHVLGFGDPVAISAETGLGMAELYATILPLLEDYVRQLPNGEDPAPFVSLAAQDGGLNSGAIGNGLVGVDALAQLLPIEEVLQQLLHLGNPGRASDKTLGILVGHNKCEVDTSPETEDNSESKIPMQLAIVGRPNVGKSTLLNTLLQEERVLVGPESGLTRDSIRAKFQFEDRTIYLVDTAGWLHRSGQEKSPSSLSVVQTKKNLMRAHVIALVLDGEEIAKSRSSMKHDEVIIARQAVEEGRALVVIVNKMDLLRGKRNSLLYEKVLKAVPEEIQTLIPQITGIPVVFISAMEGRGRLEVMHQVVDAYQKWCSRLSTARLNRWLRKVMSRHSWKDQATQPRIKYFTQVKARPPTFVAFLTGKTQLSETDMRFLIKSLKEDFDLGGIPIRIMQRSIPRKTSNSRSGGSIKNASARPRVRSKSDKRFTPSERLVSP